MEREAVLKDFVYYVEPCRARYALWELSDGHFHTFRSYGRWCGGFEYEREHFIESCSRGAYIVGVRTARTKKEAIAQNILDSDGFCY